MFHQPRGRNLACLVYSCIPIISHKPSTKQLFNKYQLCVSMVNSKTIVQNQDQMVTRVFCVIRVRQPEAKRATGSHVEKGSNSRLFKHHFQSPCNSKHSPNKPHSLSSCASSSFTWQRTTHHPSMNHGKQETLLLCSQLK